MQRNKKNEQGFTLIEILVVIGIIAILAAVVLVAINPARQFAQANNSQRESNVNAIINAVGQYMADNQGRYPATSTSTPAQITQTLCDELVPDYMPAMPSDPMSSLNGESVECTELGGGQQTDYFIGTTTADRIVVEAPNAELDKEIKVTR